MPKTKQCESPKMIPFATFDEYKDKYKDNFILERTESGVLTAKMCLDADKNEYHSCVWDYPIHRAIHQLCHDVGQDAETEVLVLGGTGERFLTAADHVSVPDNPENARWLLYEHNYYDGCNMVEAIVNDVEQPTIGVINGPASHSEIALLCDVTLMAEEAFIADPHFAMGILPGDGVQIALRALMGPKRANYMMMFNQRITPEMALDIGLVNEVVPRAKIYDRALELAEELAAKPRLVRRTLVQTMRLPLKEQIAKELRTTFGTEMWGNYTIKFNHDEGFKTAFFAD